MVSRRGRTPKIRRLRGRQTRGTSKQKRRRTRRGGTKDKSGRYVCTVTVNGRPCGKSFKRGTHLIRHRQDKHSGRATTSYNVERLQQATSPRTIARQELAKVHGWLAGPLRDRVISQLVREGWDRADVTAAVMESIVRISADPVPATLAPGWPGIHGSERQRDRKALLEGILRTEALERLQFILKAGEPNTNTSGSWRDNLRKKGETFTPEFEKVLKSDQLYRRPFQPSRALVQASHLATSSGDLPVDTATAGREHDPPELWELPTTKAIAKSMRALPPSPPLSPY